MTEVYRPVGGKLLTTQFYFMGVLALIAGYFLVRRFVFGIGDISHLSDGFPWGLWITYDVVVGTALACGGYAMA
ncbi:MAG TPA: Ni/Fe-hydrogenase cytochrome b subunit, partial [Rhodospirillales bacterium]|nr:Ni/Fe-hydrogenase cytochrome b subunit [Rhodospirillales bacterium]